MGSGSISKTMNSASINRGEYYRKSNNMDSARYYYSLANPPSSSNNALLLYRELAHYYVKERVPDSALIYAEKYVTMDDTVYRQSVRREFQKMHALYNYERNERIVQQKENKLKSIRFLSLIIVLSLIFLIVLIMVIESRKKAKMKIRINTLNAAYTESLNNYNHANIQLSTLKKAFETNKVLLDTLQSERAQNTSLICRLEQEVESYSSQINRKQSEIEKLKQTISGFLNEENVSSALSLDNNILEQPVILELHDIIKSGRRPTDHELEKVKSIAEAYYPDFTPNIRKLYPKISSENIMLCILIKLRFIASELGIIFDLKAQAVSNRRRELYKIMFKKTGGTKEFDHRIRIL